MLVQSKAEALKYLKELAGDAVDFKAGSLPPDEAREILLDHENQLNAIDILMAHDAVPESFCGAHCGWTGPSPGLGTIEDIHDRLLPGRDCPSGQCPECGKLTFQRKDLGYEG